MTTKRVKATAFASKTEFVQALDDIAAMSVELRKLEAERDAELQLIQESFNEDIIEVKTRIKGLAAQAEKYALSHKAELFPGEKKSSETALALWGFRTGNKTLVLLNKKWSWEAVINALKSTGRQMFVVTKETPDKENMKALLDDDALASVGCRIDQDEAFWIEPKLETSNSKLF